MSVIYPNSNDLYKALKAEGFELPKNCGDIELEVPVDGAFVLRYRVTLDGDDLQRVGRALAKIGLGAQTVKVHRCPNCRRCRMPGDPLCPCGATMELVEGTLSDV